MLEHFFLSQQKSSKLCVEKVGQNLLSPEGQFKNRFSPIYLSVFSLIVRAKKQL